jgi:hypothetical protein
MASPGDRDSSKDWWLENACHIAAHRLRNSPYLSANTIPIRDQVKDSVEFVRLASEANERSLREEDQ